MRSATITLALAATALALVAGCSTGTGTATPTTTAATTATLPAYGAPKVDRPLDTTKYQQNPCSVLTPAQLPALGDHGGQGTPEPLASCNWADPTSANVLGDGFDNQTGNRTGLSGTYQNRSGYQIFQPTQIAGYPAVIVVQQGHGGQGECDVEVGTADDLEVDFNVVLNQGYPNYGTPCVVAQQLAQAGVTTMKSGS